ncbi:thiol:disulfide interchange protein [Polaribacter pacificus]|uniref:Thiol:disulfide interchange protein n=1 Tax=Polaribacter pacificus TaxID=1775173 RepID=A0A917I0Y8_9FLAO|nr:TlpA disulfide reductase family protein [Polaribacter pacificus]GGH00461.1 thiol:disulfide interchange protein [Polaribacter pacificus]
MKKIFLSILCFSLLALSSCKNEPTVAKDSFTVSGTLKGLDTKFMMTSYTGPDGNRVSDSVFVENDHFSYTAKIKEQTSIVFWPNVESTIKRTGRGYYPAKSSQFQFLAGPGDQIEFKGVVTDFIDAYPSGTDANNDLAIINKQVYPLMNQSVNIMLKKNLLDKEDPKHEVYQDSIDQLDAKVVALKKEFVKSHPNSEAATWYLSDMMMRSQTSDEESISLFNNLGEHLQNNPFYKQLDTRIKAVKTTMIGSIVPDFTTNKTLDGTEFSLNSLRGKYVLIDFWGTWCGPCVSEMPTVKEYQEKYPNRLAILGVNSGESIEKINNFIKPKNYDWQQIIKGTGADNFVLKFNVKAYPTKFILDPEGKILYKFVGSGEESFDRIDELLK